MRHSFAEKLQIDSTEELRGDEVRDRISEWRNAAASRDRRRGAEDQVAVAESPLSRSSRFDAEVGERFFELWFQCIESELSGEPPRAILEDYPSVRGQPEVAATELDRLSTRGGILWNPSGCRPPDLRVCPPLSIAKPDKTRAGRDWPNAAYGLNGLLVNPSAEYGDMDGFQQTLAPGALAASMDFQ